MTDNVKKFFEEISKNTKLQDKLIKANEDYFRSVIDVAKKQGIDLTSGDIALLLKADKNHDGRISDEELADLKAEDLRSKKADEEELSAVAGGQYTETDKGFVSNCSCYFAGGGNCDDYQNDCTCTGGGFGTLTDFGEREAAAGHIHYCGTETVPVAMWCAFYGSGSIN